MDNDAQQFHLTIFARNLDATLDIGEMRLAITGVGQGLQNPADFFAGFDFWDEKMGSHRDWGSRHVSVLDDHDHVFGRKVRFSADAPARSPGDRPDGDAALRARHSVHLLRHRAGPAQRPRNPASARGSAP